MATRKLVSSSTRKPPVEIVPVAELPSALAALFYGRSGTGKTTIASSFPKPLLLLDIREKGTDSISNVKNVDVAQINRWEEFEDFYWYLEKESKYKTIVVDQVTQLQDLAIRQAMEDDNKELDDTISKRNWGQAAGLMKTWLLNYRDLIDNGMNIVFLAHDRSDDPEGDVDDQLDPTVGARVMPSVASFLNGAVKVIGNTFIKETTSIEANKKVRKVQFGMRIGPHGVFTTKTRSPVGVKSPDILIDPDYDQIMSVIKGTYEDPVEVTRKPVKKSIRRT